LTISATDVIPISWDYLVLKAIHVSPGVMRPQTRLICEDDDGGWTSVIRCDDSFAEYLNPYAELLNAAEAGLDTEYPVVPVEFKNGKGEFSIQGAELDYPHLRDTRLNRLRAIRSALTIPEKPLF
jgi:hypothetical protein